MSIHDSTRAENVVVRSSVIPWIITSPIMTSTFAPSGNKNLEMPRCIMLMHKHNQEMSTIVAEISGFLRKRQGIATITNEADLSSAETIFRVNEASRSSPPSMEDEEKHNKKLAEQAAGKLRQDELDNI